MEQHKNPMIEWRRVNDKDCLYFIFKGNLTGPDAKNAIIKWKECLDSKKGVKVILIWDCIEMKGYEPMARSLWQSALKELRSQIEVIWLITDSALITAGARIMTLFTSYDFKIVKSSEKLIL